MGIIICHHKAKYNMYHTVSDGFLFSKGINLDKLKDWYRKKYGEILLEHELPERLERAHKYGTSELDDGYGQPDLESTLLCNRAGKDEAHLSTKKCIKRFLS